MGDTSPPDRNPSHKPSDKPSDKAIRIRELGIRLEEACTRHLGWMARVEGLQRLSGGASQETWSFDAVMGAVNRVPLILRRNTRGQAHTLSTSTEYTLVGTAFSGGVPAPEALFLLDDADGVGQGYVMRRVAGETIPRRILRDDALSTVRPHLASQCGEILARVHNLDVSEVVGLSAPPPDVHPAEAQLTQLRGLFDGFGEPHPVFEVAMRRLADEMPPDDRRGLVHGDFRNGNLVVGPDGVRAVLDWELAHIGDPAEDLGWICVPSWRFGERHHEVGGFGGLAQLLTAYESASGVSVDADRVRYWTVLGTLRWGVLCQVQAFTHRSGLTRSVELAAIGRRVCETEWDLLELLEA